MLDKDSLSCYQGCALQKHCIILYLALKIAKVKMNGITWQKCYEETRVYSATMGRFLTYKARTVMQWYHSFQMESHQATM